MPKLRRFVAVTARFVRDESGASLVEYGLLAMLIAVVSFTAMAKLVSETIQTADTLAASAPAQAVETASSGGGVLALGITIGLCVVGVLFGILMLYLRAKRSLKDRDEVRSVAVAPAPRDALPDLRAQNRVLRFIETSGQVREAATLLRTAAFALSASRGRSALDEAASLAFDIARLADRDATAFARDRSFFDYHLPKSVEVAQEYARLSALSHLSASEVEQLAGVERLLLELPRLFLAHVRAIRENDFLALAVAAEALETIAFRIEAPSTLLELA